MLRLEAFPDCLLDVALPEEVKALSGELARVDELALLQEGDAVYRPHIMVLKVVELLIAHQAEVGGGLLLPAQRVLLVLELLQPEVLVVEVRTEEALPAHVGGDLAHPAEEW